MHASELTRYDSVAVTLHWTIALCIIFMIPFGFFMGDLPDSLRPTGYVLHKSIGITVLALSAFRLIWRFMNTPPALAATMPAAQALAAKAAHWVFYFLIIAMPLSGWLMVSASQKYPTVFFWLGEVPFIPMPAGIDAKATRDQLKEIHELLAFGTLGLLVIHIGAALRHHYRLRDHTLRRMLPLWLQRKTS
ncbi:MAG: cytochrome b [Rickettsiales bacterium]